MYDLVIIMQLFLLLSFEYINWTFERKILSLTLHKGTKKLDAINRIYTNTKRKAMYILERLQFG